MAKGDKTSGDGKMTVMIFQLEGSNATLQEGFRTISQALNNVLDHRTKTKLLTAATGPKNILQDKDVIDDTEVPAGEEEVITTSNASTRVRKFRSPIVLDNIDFTNCEEPLRRFLEPHEKLGVGKKYLLAAYWLKKYRQMDEIKVDHIHTCFRHVGWQTPKDAVHPLQVLKSRKFQWLHSGTERGSYIVNHVGEGEAEKIIKGEK